MNCLSTTDSNGLIELKNLMIKRIHLTTLEMINFNYLVACIPLRQM